MPIALHSYKVDKDGNIRVRHTFYARNEDEAEEYLEEHAGNCAQFGPAFDSGDTIEILEENVSAPDVEALEAVAESQETEDEEPGEEDEDLEEEEEEEDEDD